MEPNIKNRSKTFKAIHEHEIIEEKLEHGVSLTFQETVRHYNEHWGKQKFRCFFSCGSLSSS